MKPCVRILAACQLLACTLAPAAERDQAWYLQRYEALLDGAMQDPVPELYYNDLILPAPHSALARVDDALIDGVLLHRYPRLASDRERWNVLVILLGRTADHRVSSALDPVIDLCLAGAQSSDEWLRTESVYGLGLLGDERHLPEIERLINDSSDNVAREIMRARAQIRARGKDQRM
jgi:hypothetical protein